MCAARDEYLPCFVRGKDLFEGDKSDYSNGLYICNMYIPEEVLLHILSFIDTKKILRYSLVCKRWYQMIKSYRLWAIIYHRKYNRKAKRLQWYLYYCLLSTNYFDINLLLNANGQEQFCYWKIRRNGGFKIAIEDPPIGSDPLPLNVPEFNNHTSCFVTSYSNNYKYQIIQLGKSKLFQYVMDHYKPYIYLSEWTASRLDCGSVYKLFCGFPESNSTRVPKVRPGARYYVSTGKGSKWKKIELLVKNYPEGINKIIFEHEGRDNSRLLGHYGSKMAGGVIKLLFDSIEELPKGYYKKDRYKFTKFIFNTNAEPVLESQYNPGRRNTMTDTTVRRRSIN